MLQTALCYLEAVRPILAELVALEEQGKGYRGELEATSFITAATDAERSLASAERPTEVAMHHGDRTIATVRVSNDSEVFNIPPPLLYKAPSTSKFTDGDLPAGPPLPSPLLCPRRTFLAALILASKFTQDKCYSNRAWAKLSGLPPREIGRCERALGNALDWRLWVGKAAVPAAPAASPAQTYKSITRTQSEPNLVDTANTPIESAYNATKGGMRRASTLPAEGFLPQRSSLQGASFAPFVAPNPIPPHPHLATASNSPVSDTPSLSHSPSSSTESSLSSGERTIQMSTFPDDSMTLSQSETFGQSWSWLADEGGFPDGVSAAGAVQASASPVAVINGKLLTGSGLSGFKGKLRASQSWTASTTLSFAGSSSGSLGGSLIGERPKGHPFGDTLFGHASGQDGHVHIYDPSLPYGTPTTVMQ